LVLCSEGDILWTDKNELCGLIGVGGINLPNYDFFFSFISPNPNIIEDLNFEILAETSLVLTVLYFQTGDFHQGDFDL